MTRTGKQTSETTSVEVVCSKCGSDDLSVTWHGAGGDHRTRRYAVCRSYGDDWGKPAEEHLHYQCRRCSFYWTGAVVTTAAAFKQPPPSKPEGGRGA